MALDRALPRLPIDFAQGPRFGVLPLAALCLCLVASPALGAPRSAEQDGEAIPQVQRINQELRHSWDDFQLRPAAACSDGKWCRRVFLDVVGRIPSVAELQEFTSNRSPRKKLELVNRLLDSERYAADYARNWTTLWTNILIGRSGGSERNSLTNREGMRQYLDSALRANKPYDRMVYELVTARGSNTPGTEGFNGAVNFLAMKVNEENATLATAATARTFLGLQVQCTQCHSHPFNSWKQRKFWELNAFFRQTRALRRFSPGTRDVAFAELVDEDFRGEQQDDDPRQAAIYFEQRNGLLKVAYPVFVDGTATGKSGLVREVNRREELARFMLDSPYLDKTIVNRYWAHFFGYGFTKPVDDLGPHNAPTHPALLEYLSEQIRVSGYDLKQLIRWITLSEAYGLSSRIGRGVSEDAPERGDTPKFSHFYLRSMRAEELYESLLVATKADQAGQGDAAERARRRAAWLDQFVQAFGNDEGEETTTFNGTIPQSLMMFNGELVKDATRGEEGSFLWEVASEARRPADAIKQLFLAGLARRPTREEVAIAQQLFAARTQDLYAATAANSRSRPPPPGLGALQDLWWAILNSNEFILNH